MITVRFPDGAERQYSPGTTGLDIAKGISPSLAKRTVAMALDGVLADLADPVRAELNGAGASGEPFGSVESGGSAGVEP